MWRKAMRVIHLCMGLGCGQSSPEGSLRQEMVKEPGTKSGSAVVLAAAFVSLFLSAHCVLIAQNVVLTGSFSGRITDQSGAVIAGASVDLQNLATGIQQTIETNHAGVYRFPVLTPGTYSVRARRDRKSVV